MSRRLVARAFFDILKDHCIHLDCEDESTKILKGGWVYSPNEKQSHSRRTEIFSFFNTWIKSKNLRSPTNKIGLLAFFNIVLIVHSAKFNLSKQPYVHWIVNKIDKTSPTYFGNFCLPSSVSEYLEACKFVPFEQVRNVRHSHSLTQSLAHIQMRTSDYVKNAC